MQTLLLQWQQHQQRLDRLQNWLEQPLDARSETLENHHELPTLVQSLLEDAERLGAGIESIDLLSRQSSQILEKQRLLFTSTLNDLLEARMVSLGEIFGRLPPCYSSWKRFTINL